MISCAESSRPGHKVWRAFGAITLLASAYLAEVLRGALQAVPDGQRDAAAALGLIANAHSGS